MTTTDFRAEVRHALAMAAGEYQPKESPLAPAFVDRAVELLAGRETERLDPAMRAARSGAEFLADLRDLLNDEAFAGILPYLVVALRAAQVDIPEEPPEVVSQRTASAEERRAFRFLLESSSLGTPGARAMRKRGAGEELTAEEEVAVEDEFRDLDRAIRPARRRPNAG